MRPGPSDVREGARKLHVGTMALLGILMLSGCNDSDSDAAGPPTADDETLVVYCAHDRVYSQQILEQFTKDTGIRVDDKYDTELTKSLGLVQLLITEADAPRCDVFWNNELLGTMDLQDAGVLEPYKGSAWQRMDRLYRDPDGYWVGFAGRLRVWIVNTSSDRVVPTIDSVQEAMQADDLSHVTMAKPLFGTTRTHYTVLWDHMGADGLRQWHDDVRARGLVEARSNGQTKNLVAEGACALGWTDTDDYFMARDAQKPVAMVPVYVGQEKRHTICIPNTAAIIKGTKRLEQARRFVDWLASAQNEQRLAHSAARQLPLGPVDEAQLPDEVRQLMPYVRDGYPLGQLGDARRDCLSWLKSEYGL